MSKIQERFYKNRAALNVLAGSIGNAKDIYEAAEGHVLVGVLSKNYATAREAAAAMTEYGQAIQDAVSIGLGAGDNRQAAVVAEIAASYAGSHINQVFPAVGATRANLGAKDSWINSLVSPADSPAMSIYPPVRSARGMLLRPSFRSAPPLRWSGTWAAMRSNIIR